MSDTKKEDCIDEVEADSSGIVFPRACCTTHAKLDTRESGLFKEEFRATEMILCVAKHSVAKNQIP